MIVAIILAGGLGLRFDKDVSKQFIELGDKPFLIHTIDVFESCSQIDKILVIAPKEFKSKTIDLIKKYKLKKIMDVIEGGGTRQESSYNSLKYLERRNVTIVVIHDAIRPFVTEQIINNSIESAKKYGAADVMVKATDTIVKVKNGFITEIPERKYLYHGQTPQAFKYNLIWEAHKKAKKEGYANASDDAKLILRIGQRVKIIEGNYENIKLTNQSDLLFFKALFERKSA